MLVLGRHKEESVIIIVPPSTEETRVKLTVLRTAANYAKLGFVAEERVQIWREELLGGGSGV